MSTTVRDYLKGAKLAVKDMQENDERWSKEASQQFVQNLNKAVEWSDNIDFIKVALKAEEMFNEVYPLGQVARKLKEAELKIQEDSE